MTPEQIEAKGQELLKVLDEIYLRNEIKTFKVEQVFECTFINFYINPRIGYSMTKSVIEKLSKLNLLFYYSPINPHFYYTIRKK